MTIYNVVATSPSSGMVEVVKNATTAAKIEKDAGGKREKRIREKPNKKQKRRETKEKKEAREKKQSTGHQVDGWSCKECDNCCKDWKRWWK